MRVWMRVVVATSVMATAALGGASDADANGPITSLSSCGGGHFQNSDGQCIPDESSGLPRGLVFSPHGLADPNDDEFLQAMSAVGLVSDDGPAGLIRLAHKVCQDRANRYSDLISATMVNNGNPGLGMNGAGYIVAAAEHVYCPQFSSPMPPN